MPSFGDGDTSYRAAGERAGLRLLVDAFYDAMERRPDAEKILRMHPPDLTLSREKLWVFLCGWLGGPKEYATRFRPIRIPRVHAHLDIHEAERDAWLACMHEAVHAQPWTDDFKAYFMSAIAVPAERSRMAAEARRAEKAGSAPTEA